MRCQRGITLTELTVVMVLATMVMVGLMTFYFSSQATWLDGSTQAVTQREGTLVIGQITKWVHRAATAEVYSNVIDPNHDELILKDRLDNEIIRFRWNPVDSLLHERIGAPPGGVDHGPMAISKVEQFKVLGSDSLVEVQVLELRTASGEHVHTASTAALYNSVIR
jgi:hypothetical protein